MVDYNDYIISFHGASVPVESWPLYSRKAEAQLAKYKHIYTVTGDADAEKMAICAMAEALYNFDLAESGEGQIQSASIGSVSVNYGAVKTDTSPKAKSQVLYRCASLYLCIYRGCG